MGRPPRINHADAYYHVMTRGNRRADIFTRDDDRRLFLSLLARTCNAYAWRCLSYCLMGNHYHLVITTERPTLSGGMHFLNGTYARAFNSIHAKTGHVFESRYYPKLIDDDRYLLASMAYVESNPVRAKLCRGAGDWFWNSYRAVLGLRAHGRWFDRSRVLSLFDLDETSAVEQYIALIDERIDGAPPWHPEAQRQRQRASIVAAHLAGKSARRIAIEQRVSPRTVRRTILGD